MCQGSGQTVPSPRPPMVWSLYFPGLGQSFHYGALLPIQSTYTSNQFKPAIHPSIHPIHRSNPSIYPSIQPSLPSPNTSHRGGGGENLNLHHPSNQSNLSIHPIQSVPPIHLSMFSPLPTHRGERGEYQVFDF